MATYTAAAATPGYAVQAPMTGLAAIIYGSIALTTALASGDVVQLVQVPNGYRVISVVCDIDPLDSNATPTLTGTIGDTGSTGRYITLTAAQLKAGVIQSNNVQPSVGQQYAIATSGGQPGFTLISFKATANPATWVNGTMRLAATIVQDSAQAGAPFA